MKSSFEDLSHSDSGSTRNSMYASSSFSRSSPPLCSTPNSPAAPINKPIRPKSRTSLSLNANEFVPTSSLSSSSSYGLSPNSSSNEWNFGNSCDSRINASGVCFNTALSFPLGLNAASLNLLNTQAQAQNQLLRQQLLQEKQQILQRQQEIAAATVAKQQLILSATAAAKHPQDEIANSLKMFACLSACKANESTHSPLDEVMQDFATNGYTTDDFNRYQQYQAATNTPMQMLANTSIFPTSNNYDQQLNALNPGINNTNWYLNQQQQLLQENVYNEIWRQNFVHLMRQAEMANAAAAAAAAINMDYNRKTAKPFKRNFYKKDVPVTAKRCVFCENNKEPEAVVKSHAVRDSQGRVLCPKLRIYVCPICHASGDDAHTVKYCPQKPIITMEDAIKAETTGRMPHHTGAAYAAVAKPSLNSN